MDYKGELRVIDTEQKAYFLGFMFADGCISHIKRKESTYVKPQVQISLVDEEIINKFHNLFPFFNLQVFDYSRYNIKNNKQFALRKANTELFSDLQSHGMLERKSIENSSLLKLPSLKKGLIPHFIRGYFDGNGSISTSVKRPNLRRVEICSTSQEFLLQIKSALEGYHINCPIFRKKDRNVALYVLEWVLSSDILDLRHFFYDNATIYLLRKKERFDSFRIVDRKYGNPLCIHCGGIVYKAGLRQMKHGLMHRYVCTICNRRFSVLAQLKSDKLLENPEEDNQQPIISLND